MGQNPMARTQPVDAALDASQLLTQRAEDATAKPDDLVTLAYTTHILDKKYELYRWGNEKVYLLVTANGVMAGLEYLLYQQHTTLPRPAAITLVLSFSSMVFSLLQCLRHVIPQHGDAGLHNDNVIRTAAVTERLTKDEFKQAIFGLSVHDMISQNCDQIKGMNRHIVRSNSAIRQGVYATAIGIVFLIATLAGTL